MKKQILSSLFIVFFVFGGFGNLKGSFAAPYPSSPIKIMTSAAPGGSLSRGAMAAAPYLEKNLGVPITIDYVPGAEGVIAYNKFNKEKSDGYTLLYCYAASALTAERKEEAKYQVRKFSLIASWNYYDQGIIVHPDTWKTFPAFLNEARKRNMSVVGQGGHGFVCYRLLEVGFGLKLNYVPYEASGEAIAAVAGKHVDAVLTPSSTPLSMIRAGKLRALAIMGSVRDPFLPEVPSFKELGYGDVPTMSTTYGIFAAPPNTPKEILATLEKAISTMVANPEFNKVAKDMGLIVKFVGSSELNKLVLGQYEVLEKYKELIFKK